MNIRRFNEHDYEAFQGAWEFESGELPFIGEAELAGFGNDTQAAVVGARKGIEVCTLTTDGEQGPTLTLRIEGEKGIEAILRSLPETLTPEILRDYGFRSW